MAESPSRGRGAGIRPALRAWLTMAMVVVLLWMLNAIRLDIRRASETLQAMEERYATLQARSDDAAHQLALVNEHVDRLLGYVDTYLPGLSRSQGLNSAAPK